jgi:acyl-CoA reductase-like NAD-dependent aldehyde dehydrogenase
MAESFGLFIDGEARPGVEHRTVTAPWDGAALAEVAMATPRELDEAIGAAERAFEGLRKLPSHARSSLCRRIAAGIDSAREELAVGLCLEAGKPIADARAEVDRAAHCFEIAAEEAMRLGGETMPLDRRPSSDGRWGITRRFPVGPIAAISPFNFPLNLAVHKVAPALAAGCPVVLKPASQTPLSCLRLARIMAAADLPRGALNVLPMARAAADALVEDDRLKLLTFTGSPEVGWALKARARKKKVVLELGGNAAVVVDEGADLDHAVTRIIYGAYSYAGQKCISVQRIYVHEKVHDQVRDRLTRAIGAIKSGDPQDPSVLVGPMIDRANADRVEAWVDEATQHGARALARGVRRDNLVPPILLENVPSDVHLSCDEAFGPVATLDAVATFEEGLRRAGDSRFGLQAGIFTRDLARAWKAFEELEVGGVIVNDSPAYRIDHMPYGGVRDSGLGREGIRYAIEDMTETRIMVLAL